MDASGGGQAQLTDTDPFFREHHPTYSPDGRKIAFESGGWIYVADVGGTSQVPLVEGGEPAFSPDGQRIAYAANANDGVDIFTIKLDGSEKINVTNNFAISEDRNPTFSPDGQRIAFDSRGYDGEDNHEINVIDANGANRRILTNTSVAVYNVSPNFSPDGSEIAFVSSRNLCCGNGDVYVMDIVDLDEDGNGDNLRRLTYTGDSDGGSYTPAYSPDGQKIAFERGRDIYVMDDDGGGQTNLTNADYDTQELEPDWGPLAGGAPVITPETAVQDLGGGDTLTTDPENDGASTTDPVETSVATPVAGSVSISEIVISEPPPAGFSFFGQQVDITASAATADDPLILEFRLDSSLIPEGGDHDTIQVFRNGLRVEDCSGASGEASPDPCVAERETLADGDVRLLVYTSAASSWNFGVATDEDKSAITLATPADGAVYILNQAVHADYSCEDESGGSGLASCVGTVPDGEYIDTSSVGAKTFTVNATDEVGNESSASHGYSVVYDFEGFFHPVNNLPTLNMAKAGSTIPIKFRLGGDQGLDILADGYPKSQQIACDSTDTTDGIEETANTDPRGLHYDEHPRPGQYHYNWKTDKSWSGTCRQFVMKLDDDSTHRVNFKFKKGP